MFDYEAPSIWTRFFNLFRKKKAVSSYPIILQRQEPEAWDADRWHPVQRPARPTLPMTPVQSSSADDEANLLSAMIISEIANVATDQPAQPAQEATAFAGFDGGDSGGAGATDTFQSPDPTPDN